MTFPALLLQFQRLIFSCFGLLAIVISPLPALASNVEITSFGHSALLIKGGGKSVLVNPFKAVGCASKLKEPKIKVNVILASSELADEGARVAKGLFLVNPGSYRVGNMKIEGFAVDHDRIGGRRYGQGTIWQWEQNGINFVHMGGVAAPLKIEEKLLIGRPDVLILAVGGGAKVYNAKEAAQLVNELNPKRVIPVQYLTNNSPEECKLDEVQPFLDLLAEANIRQVGKIFSFSNTTSNDLIINIMN